MAKRTTSPSPIAPSIERSVLQEAKARSLGSHQSSRMKNDEWLTPPEIVRALGPFDLDPCSPINRPWPTATTHYTKQDDGLSKPWAGRVWMNPPFGAEARKWIQKAALHGDAIALLPARTETAMFFESVWGVADAVLFLKGRPHFCYVDGTRAPFNSGAPILLIAYGQANAEALRSAVRDGAIAGVVVDAKPPSAGSPDTVLEAAR